MNKGPSKTSKISILIPRKEFDELNALLGGRRIKTKLFEKIARDLLVALRRMTPDERCLFFGTIFSSDVDLMDWVEKPKKEGEQDAE